jgi:GNAT superfamily N-acetyltransferase
MIVLPPGYELTEDQSRIDPVAAHAFLTTSYWAEGIPLETVRKSFEHSFCIAVTKDGAQVGFARLVTDYATFAILSDVYVLADHQGLGIAQAMLSHLQSHALFQGLRRWALFTKDAQSLYQRFGWQHYPMPERFMTRDFPAIYQ